MDAPEDEALVQDEPRHLAWFALGHVAVLLYLAVHVLLHLTPVEQTFAWAATLGIIGLVLAHLVRRKVRTALALTKRFGVPDA